MEQITPESLTGCHLKQAMHLDGQDKDGKWFADIGRVVEYPRLMRKDKMWRKRSMPAITTWWVDGEDKGTLEEALAYLNANPVPPINAAEKGALMAFPDDWEIHDDLPPQVVINLRDKGLVEMRRENGHREYRRTDLGRQAIGGKDDGQEGN